MLPLFLAVALELEDGMKFSIPRIGLVLTSSLFAAGSVLAQTPTISLQAVKVNDVAITPSNAITVKPGDSVIAEIFVSDWSPDGERRRKR